MQSLLKSRKFWLAVFAVVQTLISHYLMIPADIWQAIDALVVVLIGTIAVEDAAAKAGGQAGPTA
jgi:hypothetical protein